MRERISKFLKKLNFIGVVAASAITLVGSGSVGFPTIKPLQPATAAAASSCPYESEVVERTNIVYCGLSGGKDTAQLMQSFQSYYTANSDAHPGNPDTHTDLQSVYNQVADMSVGGFNSKMFTTGPWEVGTVTNSGVILDNLGHTVATDVRITSRCVEIDYSPNANCKPDEIAKGLYKPLNDSKGNHITNVYYRNATWYVQPGVSSLPALLHFNTSGALDFASETECGNTLIFKPVLPQTLVCKQLDYKLDSQDDNSFVYSFVVTATAQNVSNITYKIDYGDGTTESKPVSNGQTTMNFGPHTYTRLENDKVYTIKAIVNNQPQVAACQKNITVTAKSKLTFACVDLKADLDSSSTPTNQIYNFVGQVQGTDTAASYTFTFTNVDGSQSTVNASPSSSNPQQSNQVQYKYSIDTTKVQTFSASFVATSKTGLTFGTTSACQFSMTTKLPSTGPEGTLGIFAGTSALGVGLHQLVLRRKAKSLL